MDIDGKKLNSSQNVSSNDEASSQDASHCNAKINNMDNMPDHNEQHHHSNSKKVIKHALRQLARRWCKSTTIAAGDSAQVSRSVMPKLLHPQPVEEVPLVVHPVKPQHATMREVLESIPGFNIKPHKRTNKKLTTAAQLEQVKEGCIDLETPDSILVNTNLRSLMNKYTFAVLPPLYQHKLVQLLPAVDRPPVTDSTDVATRLSASGLNNEFFARACLEWQESLADGELIPEDEHKLKSEANKKRSRLDPWKLKHFGPIWGERIQGGETIPMKEPSSPQPPIKLRPSTSISNKSQPVPFIKSLRTVGAVTRSCTRYKAELEASNQLEAITRSPIPDLLPIKTHKSQMQKSATDNTSNTKHTSSRVVQESEPFEVKEPTGSNVAEVQETQPTVNISDTVMQTNEKTIISCRENNNKVDKRRRSLSSESEQRLTKRKTPGPIEVNLQVEDVAESNSIEDKNETDNLNTITSKTGYVIPNNNTELNDECVEEEPMEMCNENVDHDQQENILDMDSETDYAIRSHCFGQKQPVLKIVPKKFAWRVLQK